MTIEYRVGDLLQCSEKVIVHGCNAQGVMGSGVAKQLRDADEDIFKQYRKFYDNSPGPWGLELGTIIPFYSVKMDKLVINAITQNYYGKDGHKYVSYYGLMKAMRRIDNLTFDGPRIVAMPMIGAGLAGGDWNVISALIKEAFTQTSAVVYTLDIKDVWK